MSERTFTVTIETDETGPLANWIEEAIAEAEYIDFDSLEVVEVAS